MIHIILLARFKVVIINEEEPVQQEQSQNWDVIVLLTTLLVVYISKKVWKQKIREQERQKLQDLLNSDTSNIIEQLELLIKKTNGKWCIFRITKLFTKIY